jgi:hypothetical protein
VVRVASLPSLLARSLYAAVIPKLFSGPSSVQALGISPKYHSPISVCRTCSVIPSLVGVYQSLCIVAPILRSQHSIRESLLVSPIQFWQIWVIVIWVCFPWRFCSDKRLTCSSSARYVDIYPLALPMVLCYAGICTKSNELPARLTDSGFTEHSELILQARQLYPSCDGYSFDIAQLHQPVGDYVYHFLYRIRARIVSFSVDYHCECTDLRAS